MYVDIQFFSRFHSPLQDCHDLKKLLSSLTCPWNENHCLISSVHTSIDCAASLLLFSFSTPAEANQTFEQNYPICNILHRYKQSYSLRKNIFLFTVILHCFLKCQHLKWFKVICERPEYSIKCIMFPFSFRRCCLVYNSACSFIFFRS